MTKRFTLIDGVKKGTHSGILDNQKQHNQGIGDELWIGEVVGMLNEGVMIAEENEQLKKEVINLKVEIDTHKHPLWSTREAERIINELKKENGQLKEENETLSKALTIYFESKNKW